MFDSFIINCPSCGKELEFQSKSGSCSLARYGLKPYIPLFPKESQPKPSNECPAEVAIGLIGHVARCQFCNNRIILDFDIPEIEIKARSIGKKAKFTYEGNYNEKHPESIKRAKELRKFLKS